MNATAKMLSCCLAAALLILYPLRAELQDDRGRMRELLFPDGKAVGQPYTRFRPDIRMVRVTSWREGYLFFLALCGHKGINSYMHQGWKYYFASPDASAGWIVYTRRVEPNRNEVGILYFTMPEIKMAGISEIHFVETIKIGSGKSPPQR